MAFWDQPTDNTCGWKSSIETKTEPGASKKNNGYANEEVIAYENHNWLLYALSTWDDWFKDQLNIIGTTEDTDSPAAKNYTDAQAYLDSLPYHINHNITLTLIHDGSTHAGNVLTASNLHGNGTLTIKGAADIASWTDTSGGVSLTNCTCPVVIEDIKFSATYGVTLDGVTDATIDDCYFTDNLLKTLGNTNATISNVDSYGSPTTLVNAYDFSRVIIDDTNDFSNDEFGGPLIGINDNAIVNLLDGTTIVTQEDVGYRFNSVYCVDGGVFLSGAGLNSQSKLFGSDSIIKALGDATALKHVDANISLFPKYIPVDKTFKVDLPTTTGTLYSDKSVIYVDGFHGGGTFLLEGNGSGSTIIQSNESDNAVDLIIQNCSTDVRIDGFQLYSSATGAGADSPTISIINCSGNITLDDVKILTDSDQASSVTTAISIQNSPCVTIENCEIDCSGSADVYDNLLKAEGRSGVYSDTNTSTGNDGGTYGTYATEGSFIGTNGTTFTGDTTLYSDKGGLVVEGTTAVLT